MAIIAMRFAMETIEELEAAIQHNTKETDQLIEWLDRQVEGYTSLQITAMCATLASEKVKKRQQPLKRDVVVLGLLTWSTARMKAQLAMLKEQNL